MTPDHRTALAALDAVRPQVARLDPAHHPEEVAADLIESWSGVETALRAALGGSALAGQALVGEARQRGVLDLPHAHALLSYLAARDRAARPEHRPTYDDVDAARAGYQAVEAALGVGIAANTAVHRTVTPEGGSAVRPPASAGTALPDVRASAWAPPSRGDGRGAGAGATTSGAAGQRPAGASSTEPEPAPARGGAGSRPGGSRRVLFLAALATVLVALLGAWYLWSEAREPRGLRRGVAAYAAGEREVARREFEAVAADHPELPLPHVYLGRLAREDGDVPRALRELERAIQADPGSATALREMGQLMLQTGRDDVAARFLERAIRADPADRVAQGWMGCALARQGRPDVAANFFRRAGQGDWTPCERAPATPMGGRMGAPVGPPAPYPPAPLPPPPPRP